ncbi:MAG: hypothetical protein ACK47M_14340, partial [Caldilinea sp.]
LISAWQIRFDTYDEGRPGLVDASCGLVHRYATENRDSSGLPGAFTPIQFASDDEHSHRHKAFKKAITAICRCQNYKCLRYNEFHESTINLRSLHRHRFVERLALAATLPGFNRTRQLAR